jgi:hypothetical protein
MAKSKLKIKELKKKIKVKEISEEGEVISDEEEDSSFRSSSRSSSASSSPVLETREIVQESEFEQVPARAEEERTSAVRYEPIVSRSMEGESEAPSRRYSASAQQRSAEGERTAPILRQQGIAPQRTEGLFERGGISANGEAREEKYELKKESVAGGKKHKYPWEM